MHTGGVRVGKGVKQQPTRKFFKKLVNKNTIKAKIIIPESLDPTCINLSYPLPWIFNPCASLTLSSIVYSSIVKVKASLSHPNQKKRQLKRKPKTHHRVKVK
jgi:hypothetical protein